MKKFEVKLSRVRTLSESTRDFRFERVDGGQIHYEPGQFFRFIFTDSQGDFERSYSVCNFLPDVKSSMLDLVVSTVEKGRASQLLFGDVDGLTARVSGPYGRLLLPETIPKRLFLVATSVGIAPYMPMLEKLEQWFSEDEAVEVHFLYGARNESEFVYGDWLETFAGRHLRFFVHLCLSREDVASYDKSNTGTVLRYQGYVQDRLRKLSPNPEGDHVLLCGNPNMIDAAYSGLKTAGFGVRQVVREKYVFAKDPVEKGLQNVGDTPVPTAEQKRLIAEKMKRYRKT